VKWDTNYQSGLLERNARAYEWQLAQSFGELFGCITSDLDPFCWDLGEHLSFVVRDLSSGPAPITSLPNTYCCRTGFSNQ
jgi:hypothetical protein